MKKTQHFLFGTLLVILFLPCNSGAQVSSDPYVPCQEMPMLIENFNADFHAITRYYNTSFYGSRGGGDRNSPGGSPEKRQRLDELFHEYLSKLEKIDFKSLPQECKVDYILLKRDLTEKLRQSAEEEVVYGKIKNWFPFSDSVYEVEKLRRRGHPLDAQRLAKNWFDYSSQLRTFRARLKTDSGLDMASIYEAGLVVADLKRAIANINDFYSGYDPQYTWWMPKAYKDLDDALNGYAETFKEKSSRFAAPDKSGIAGHPAGRQELLRELKYEMIPYSPLTKWVVAMTGKAPWRR
jgi:hypothetical protein